MWQTTGFLRTIFTIFWLTKLIINILTWVPFGDDLALFWLKCDTSIWFICISLTNRSQIDRFSVRWDFLFINVNLTFYTPNNDKHEWTFCNNIWFNVFDVLVNIHRRLPSWDIDSLTCKQISWYLLLSASAQLILLFSLPRGTSIQLCSVSWVWLMTLQYIAVGYLAADFPLEFWPGSDF